jgi:hypothetical protein
MKPRALIVLASFLAAVACRAATAQTAMVFAGTAAPP